MKKLRAYTEKELARLARLEDLVFPVNEIGIRDGEGRTPEELEKDYGRRKLDRWLAFVEKMLEKPFFSVNEVCGFSPEQGETTIPPVWFWFLWTRPNVGKGFAKVLGQSQNHVKGLEDLDRLLKLYTGDKEADREADIWDKKGDLPDRLIIRLREEHNLGLGFASEKTFHSLVQLKDKLEAVLLRVKEEDKPLPVSIARKSKPLEYVAVPTDLHFQRLTSLDRNGLITTYYDGGFLFEDGSYISLGIDGCIAPVSIMHLLGLWCVLCEYFQKAPLADARGGSRFVGYNDLGNAQRGKESGGGGLTPSSIATLKNDMEILKRTFAIIRHDDGREEHLPLILVERELVKGEFEVNGQKVKNGFILTKTPLMDYFKSKGFTFNIKSEVFQFKRSTKLNQSLAFTLASSAGACHNLGNKMVIATKDLRRSLGRVARTKQDFRESFEEVLENFDKAEGGRFNLTLDKEAGKLAISEKKAFRKGKKS